MPKQTRKRKITKTNDDNDVQPAKHRNLEEAQHETGKLDSILFGGTSSFLRSLEEAELEIAKQSAVDSGVGEEDSDTSEEKLRRPAWTDEEDDGIDVGRALKAQHRRLPDGGVNSRDNKYTDLLRHKFVSAYGNPKWASLDKEKDDSDCEEEILRTCGFIEKRQSITLPSGVVDFKKMKDVNQETYSEGPHVNCVEFNTASSVALVAGQNGVASLYAVDGKRNSKLHSVAFERFTILCGKFIRNGEEAVLGSRLPFIYSYDLMAAKAIRVPLPHGLTQLKNFTVSPDQQFLAAAGKWGEIHLLTAATKERVALLKQDGNVTSLTFDPSNQLLYSHSDSNMITVFDMKNRRVRHKFEDEGCLQGSKLAISSSNQFLAAGSAQGVVNLYGVDDVLKCKCPKPRKTIFNLTTAITGLTFNHTSEILGIASSHIENAVKLFHVGSGSVFQNFPNYSMKLRHVNVLNFSPNSGYVAFGDQKSTVSLYRLKHYKNY